MIKISFLSLILSLIFHNQFAQVVQLKQSSPTILSLTSDESGSGCSTPNLDSAQAVSLSYYGNNQFIENYLIQNGYNTLESIYFPSPQESRTSSTSFLEPNFLIPINIFIYRNGVNDPNSSINEEEARNYICLVNEIYRNTGTAIQFYTNRVEFEANNFFNQQVSTNPHVYDLWSRKRIISDNSKGINVHFLRYNSAPEDGFGKASLPHYPVLPYTNYSCYVRTHNNPSGAQRSDVNIAATLAHEIGHTLALLHTHHPGRLPSLVLNGENGTVSNGCLQESVSRVKRNYWYNGCVGSDNKLKCEINGDFLCDTQADPNQSGRVLACAYIHPTAGDFREDNWGELWTPPTNNVMSYTTGDCRNEFSRHQTGIMWMQMPHLKSFIGYQTPQITASSTSICSGTTTSFSLSGTLPNDANITWNIEPANIVNVSSGSGSIANISASNSLANGNAKITFTILGPGNCYIARLQYSVWVGKVNVAEIDLGSLSSYPYVCPNTTYSVFLTPEVPGFTYEIEVSNGTYSSPLPSMPNFYYVHIGNYTPSQYADASVTGRINSGCGWSDKYLILYSDPYMCPPEGCEFCYFSISPNPANDEIYFEIDEEEWNSKKLNRKNLEYQLVLKNNEGQVQTKVQSNQRKTKIDVRNMTRGIYYLQFISDEFQTTRRVVINK